MQILCLPLQNAMPISTSIEFSPLDELFLDPINTRLGRHHAAADLTQEKILSLMAGWALEELAESFVRNGFWPQEALVLVVEALYGDEKKVVVEGNRRLAALKLLKQANDGNPLSGRWEKLAERLDETAAGTLFSQVPYVTADERSDVDAFLGFRHVTGIKEWQPAEKAEYICKLVDAGTSYDEVRRMIGSNTPTVRRNYIAYRLLLQIEDACETVDRDYVAGRFSVMFLSLRSDGTREFLGVDLDAEPDAAATPVDEAHLPNLNDYAIWLFGERGDDGKPPLFTDSRLTDKFGVILGSEEGVEYLRAAEPPSFEVAYRTAGGDEAELVRLVRQAAENVELALTRAHANRDSEQLQKVVRRLGEDTNQLLSIFPAIRDALDENR